MQELKVKGIICKLIDYKDADKLASIFTLERGKILAKFTGVKREKAKFKALAQPFVFAEFNINDKGNKTITNAYLLDSFKDVLTDYSRMMNGYIVLDIINSILPNEKSEKEIFALTISALKNVETKNPYIATIEFILNFLNFSGLELIFVEGNQIYLDKSSGNFTNIKDNFSSLIDLKVYSCLYNIAKNSYVEENLQERTLKQVLRLLHNVIFIKFNEDIKSFEFI